LGVAHKQGTGLGTTSRRECYHASLWPVQRDYATLFVPIAAITTNLQRTFVVRVRNGKAEWVDVKTGASAGGKTEVFGDLKDGDQVVLPASDELAPGTTVVTHATGNKT
jgi:hypothetical protein